MNPLDAITFFRVTRTKSLSLALILSVAMLGGSVAYAIRESLRSVGLIWPLAFVATFIVIGWCIRQESKLPISDAFRRWTALGTVTLAFLLSSSLGWYKAQWEKDLPPEPPKNTSPLKSRGPRR